MKQKIAEWKDGEKQILEIEVDDTKYPEEATPIEKIEAQAIYTALITDTLLEEG